MAKVFKADLHVHSKHSNKPSIWALRKFNCPESYTTPAFIYTAALERGMDYVTITDHNSINGALEIAHLPGAFISAEVTTYFPEDGCKIHTVVLDINEGIFDDLMPLRKNIYEMTGYLRGRGVAHFAAHPLYDMNMKMSADNIEKIFLLFNVLEGRNGARAHRYNKMISRLSAALTPERLAGLAEKHGIEPYGETPWNKTLVGGSDDHSGFFVARVHTVSTAGGSVKEFVASLGEHEAWPGGEDGNALILAHSIYGIGYRFFSERFEKGKGASMPFLNTLMRSVLTADNGKQSLFDKVNLFIRKNLPEMYTGYDGKTFEEILDREAKLLLTDKKFLRPLGAEDVNRKIFAVSSCLANRMMYIYTDRLARTYSPQGIIGLVNSLSAIGLVHLLAVPYYVAFHHQHRGKELLRELESRCACRDAGVKDKIALFTDTLHEINGVAVTIKRLIETAHRQGVELVVITAGTGDPGFRDGIMTFKSVGDCALPEYPELKLHFPPILDVIDYFEKEGFTRIHASMALSDEGHEGTLVVTGDGPYRRELEHKLKGYPVVFTGFFTGGELHSLYASSDVFVFPSATDTFGNVVLEAQASGLPVIVSDEGGPRELVVDGVTGIVVQANNRHALIEAMRYFSTNRDMIKTMGENARNFTERNGIDPGAAYSTLLKSGAGVQ